MNKNVTIQVQDFNWEKALPELEVLEGLGVALKFTFFILFMNFSLPHANADMYLITHATYQGETGHSAIAVENYDIIVKDTFINNKATIIFDTLKNGRLTYYDFWPTTEEEFDIKTADKNVTAKFNRIASVTEWSILKLGITKINEKPCDGLVKINLTTEQDFKLKKKLDSVIQISQPFNATKNNCSDFAKYAIEFITGIQLAASENILIKYQFTSPNKLFTAVSKLENATVLKNSALKIKGSFFQEKIIPIIVSKYLKTES